MVLAKPGRLQQDRGRHSLFRCHLKAPENDILDVFVVHRRWYQVDRFGLLDRHNETDNGITIMPGHFTRPYFQQNQPDTPNVAGSPIGPGSESFWAHESRGADDGRLQRLVSLERRNSKIAQFDRSIRAEQDVTRLDISM